MRFSFGRMTTAVKRTKRKLNADTYQCLIGDKNKMTPTTGWKLDKHIPIAVILTLVIQTGGIVWWASNLDTRLENLETHVAKEDAKAVQMSLPDRMTRLEVQQTYTNQMLKDILNEVRSHQPKGRE